MTENISYWLMKSEPNVYSIKNLEKEKTTIWDGIRNYQARNFMRSMKIGDIAFFYHSNCKVPGIVGLMEVTKLNIVDPTQFDPKSKYFDSKSKKEFPRWDCVEVKYLGEYEKGLSLEDLKNLYKPNELQVVRKGNRLSIIPVSISTAEEMKITLGKFK